MSAASIVGFEASFPIDPNVLDFDESICDPPVVVDVDYRWSPRSVSVSFTVDRNCSCPNRPLISIQVCVSMSCIFMSMCWLASHQLLALNSPWLQLLLAAAIFIFLLLIGAGVSFFLWRKARAAGQYQPVADPESIDAD